MHPSGSFLSEVRTSFLRTPFPAAQLCACETIAACSLQRVASHQGTSCLVSCDRTRGEAILDSVHCRGGDRSRCSGDCSRCALQTLASDCPGVKQRAQSVSYKTLIRWIDDGVNIRCRGRCGPECPISPTLPRTATLDLRSPHAAHDGRWCWTAHGIASRGCVVYMAAAGLRDGVRSQQVRGRLQVQRAS